eukprot:1360166-Pleurochrysis_carterae.AAC.2
MLRYSEERAGEAEEQARRPQAQRGKRVQSSAAARPSGTKTSNGAQAECQEAPASTSADSRTVRLEPVGASVHK